jgi:Fe-S-cluster containining protein
MEMQTIVNDWRSNAEKHHKANFRFLRSLKMKSAGPVDRLARELHREAFSIIDCTKCANCCKVFGPLFTDEDVARIALHLGLEKTAFRAEYLKKCEDEEGWELTILPCPFLGSDNRCTVYDVRPTACAEYPYTDKENVAGRTHSLAERTLDCPATFYIVEELQARGRFR